MKMGTVLKARLAAYAGVAALVGDRIYPGVSGVVQPVVYPYIVYRLIDTGHTHTMQGAAGLAMPHVQINCFVNDFDYELLEELVEQVRLALTTYRDLALGFQAAIPLTTQDLPKSDESSSQGRFIEFELHLSEAAS